MNKLPKTIYVHLYENGELRASPAVEEHAVSIEARVVGVYQIKGIVEVSIETKQEVVVRKPPSRKAPASTPPAENGTTVTDA